MTKAKWHHALIGAICQKCGRSYDRTNRHPRQRYCTRPRCQKYRDKLAKQRYAATHQEDMRRNAREWQRRNRIQYPHGKPR